MLLPNGTHSEPMSKVEDAQLRQCAKYCARAIGLNLIEERGEFSLVRKDGAKLKTYDIFETLDKLAVLDWFNGEK